MLEKNWERSWAEVLGSESEHSSAHSLLLHLLVHVLLAPGTVVALATQLGRTTGSLKVTPSVQPL